jgi:predicted methyltransferase
MKKLQCAVALFLLTCTLTACHAQEAYQTDAERLATLLKWQPGSDVAEIGAGEGQMTLLAAERVGPTGHVYTTELDPGKLAHLKELAAQHQNLTALPGAQDTTNLPADCCDSIFLRRVYHHFTEPAKIDASIFQALKPGGLLAVIDFPPHPGWSPPAGVPKNRGGHGMPQKILIDELTAVGFKLATIPADWPGDDYCVIFQKPAAK